MRDSDLQQANAQIDAFRVRWPEMGKEPLHSVDIRGRRGAFRWLQSASAERKTRFFDDVTRLMTCLPVTVLACVIDRPGYNQRYKELYGRERWTLCKTAFTIAVERAAKFAHHEGRRLRIYVEQSDKKTEGKLRGYYDEMRLAGLPFDGATSAKYQPLAADALARTLLEFKVKTKASRLMQIADVALWPACMGGYLPENVPYVALRDSGRLLDAHCTPANGLLGIKYSCFDALKASQKIQEPAEAGSGAATVQPGGDLVGNA